MDRDNLCQSLFQWKLQRRVVRIRCRKLPSVRLGRKKWQSKVDLRLNMIWRKIKLRYFTNKLKEYCRQIVQDIIDAGESYEGFQQRLIMETMAAVPIGISLNQFPKQSAVINQLHY